MIQPFHLFHPNTVEDFEQLEEEQIITREELLAEREDRKSVV